MNHVLHHRRFDPKKTCPLPSLYWAFLGRHRDVLAGVDRMKLPVLGESRRSAVQQRADAAVFDRVGAILGASDELMPDQDGLFR